MKIIVIGGVAAGTKVAAKLKRDNYSHNVRQRLKDFGYTDTLVLEGGTTFLELKEN